MIDFLADFLFPLCVGSLATLIAVIGQKKVRFMARRWRKVWR
jgi:hypothetical protein